ncbi:MAG: helix-turn-helix domain-containing protein [Gammaproteobacteria bacterium]|nr:helix-turn-helix domain-containing protein [Gammaproteobacteria bacterium]
MADSLRDVLERTALDLYDSGAISKATLRHLDLPHLPRLKSMSAFSICRLRRRLKVSQAVFAALLNVSKSTVQQWEQGKKKPGGASLKLLNLVNEKGLDALL